LSGTPAFVDKEVMAEDYPIGRAEVAIFNNDVSLELSIAV